MYKGKASFLLFLFFLSICKVFIIFFKFYFIFKLYIFVLVLPNIKMNPPQVPYSRGKNVNLLGDLIAGRLK